MLLMFIGPFLGVMEKSVQRFTVNQKARLLEPDGPTHRYGQKPAADLTKKIDDLVKKTDEIDKALNKANTKAGVPGEPPVATPPPPLPGIGGGQP